MNRILTQELHNIGEQLKQMGFIYHGNIVHEAEDLIWRLSTALEKAENAALQMKLDIESNTWQPTVLLLEP